MAKGHYAEAQLVGQVLHLGEFHDGDKDHQARFSFQVGTETDLETFNGDPLGLKFTAWITLFGNKAEDAVDALKEGDRVKVLARLQNSIVDGDFKLNFIIDDQGGEFEPQKEEEVGEYPPRQPRKEEGRGGRSRGSSSGSSSSRSKEEGRGGRSRGSSGSSSSRDENKDSRSEGGERGGGGRSENRAGGRGRRVAD